MKTFENGSIHKVFIGQYAQAKNSMMGAFMPVTLDSIWTTPSLMRLQTDAVLDPTKMIERRKYCTHTYFPASVIWK